MSSTNNQLVASKNDLHRSKLDLARANIEFVNSVFGLVSSKNPVQEAAKAIVRWLGNVSISQEDYEFCVDRCRAVTYPNENGARVRQDILDADANLGIVGGLQLSRPGVIGRWMAFSHDHSWIVTTVITASRFQGLHHATNVLCEMVLAGDEKVSNVYTPVRSRLRGTMSKIVDSVCLNVMNPGHGPGDLPEELQGLCVHIADPQTFAAIALRIQQSQRDTLLYCERFQGDLVLWLLAHYDGTVEVTVEGKIHAFENGDSRRKVSIIIQKICHTEGDAVNLKCKATCSFIELSEHTGTHWKNVLKAADDCSRRATGVHTQPLHSLRPADELTGHDLLNVLEHKLILLEAQDLMRWLLNVPLESTSDWTTLGYHALVDEKRTDSGLTIGSIVARYPRMQNEKIGIRGNKWHFVFTPQEMQSNDDDSNDSRDILESDKPDTNLIVSSFPSLEQLLFDIAVRCLCRTCRDYTAVPSGKQQSNQDTRRRFKASYTIKSGCLVHTALAEYFVHIGNSIADCMGVDKASGMSDLNAYAEEAQNAIIEILQGRLWWDDWFNLAAATALGYYAKGHKASGHLSEGGGAIAMIKYGSLVVAAKWLDLTKPLTIKGSFGIEMAEGHIRGVEDGLAIMFTECKMETKGLDAEGARHTWQEVEQDVAQIGVIVVGATNSYRLLTIARIGSNQRIVDPTDAMLGLSRSRIGKCEHDPFKPVSPSEVPHSDDAIVYDLQTLLGTWGIENEQKDKEKIYVTTVLTSHTSINIALSLTALGCVIRKSTCCPRCAASAAMKHPSTFGRRIISVDIASARDGQSARKRCAIES